GIIVKILTFSKELLKKNPNAVQGLSIGKTGCVGSLRVTHTPMARALPLALKPYEKISKISLIAGWVIGEVV
ncbi:MAG: hypothetical protein AAGE59_33705, partial [Cyanobacteria bacterium P01_F01_bin.86]